MHELSVHSNNLRKKLLTEHILAKPMRKLKHSHAITAQIDLILRTTTDYTDVMSSGVLFQCLTS